MARSLRSKPTHRAGFARDFANESAIVADLAPGGNTVILQGARSETGGASLRFYDISGSTGVKLANISTHGFLIPAITS